MFQLASEGVGENNIAKRLNAERAVSPRSQQGLPRSWAPSTVHEVLFRLVPVRPPLAAGVAVVLGARPRDALMCSLPIGIGPDLQLRRRHVDQLRRRASRLLMDAPRVTLAPSVPRRRVVAAVQ